MCTLPMGEPLSVTALLPVCSVVGWCVGRYKTSYGGLFSGCIKLQVSQPVT